MSYTQTLIGNLAMGHLGDREISDINDSQDLDAIVLKRYYAHAVRRTYESHDWIWARQNYQLQRRSETPVTRYAYAYAKPPHYRRLCNVSEYSDMRATIDEFQNADGDIQTDAETVFMEYVSGEWSEGIWPAYFADCVGVQLAIHAVMQLTHAKDVKADLMRMFKRETLPEARSVDSQGQPSRRRIIRSPWNEARMSGRGSNLRRNA